MKYYLFKRILLKCLSIVRAFRPNLLANYTAKLWYEAECERYRRRGVVLGEGSIIYDTLFSHSSKGDRFFIGKNCTITGATFLGHDASPAVFFPELCRKEYPYLPGARCSYRDPIYVGDNVFIGMGVIVLPGVHIGSDVVVAAGSVVVADVSDGQVVAGNPAKPIKTIESYKEKYSTLIAQHPERF